MFSTILPFSKPLIFPDDDDAPNSDTASIIWQLLNRQIQRELEQAAERGGGGGMVSTRSQDGTPAARGSKSLYPQVVVYEKKKRKIEDGGEESPAQAVRKKRRGSTDSNGDAEIRRSTSTRSAYGDADDARHDKGSDQEDFTQGSHPIPSHTPGITTESSLGNEKKDSVTEVAINNVPNNDVPDAHDQAKLNIEGREGSRRGRIPKKRRKDSERVAHVDQNDGGYDAEAALPKAAKATHKRFGSEDIEISKTVPSTGIEERREGRENPSEDENESEDEAPETVTASAGFDRSRELVLGAAKLAARQKAEKKTKRKEHDQRLKLQAKTANVPRSKDKPSTTARREDGSWVDATRNNDRIPIDGAESIGKFSNFIRDENQKASAKSHNSETTRLPLLLPEEILASQPVVPTPAPPRSHGKVASGKKRKFLDPESKPPKDIKCGRVTISVLEENRSMLPPKGSQDSKTLREFWLTGRRGVKGATVVPRRKPSSGFVRRK